MIVTRLYRRNDNYRNQSLSTHNQLTNYFTCLSVEKKNTTAQAPQKNTMIDTSMQQLMRNLPYMNTSAVSLLLEGKQEEAMAQFYQCLELAKAIHDSGILHERNTRHQHHDNGLRNDYTIAPVSLDEVLHPSDPSQDMSPDNCFRLFRNVFVFEVVDRSTTLCQKSLMAFVSTIHYNIAVVYQELGLGLGDLNWLSGALRFYQITQDLITRYELEAMVSTLDLALCNNMGHLFAFFSNKEGIVEMRSRLCNRLQVSTPQPQHQDVYNFFRYNLVLASDVENTIAPAA